MKKLIRNAPQGPGCYLWKNDQGSVLYVGKAKNLRARLRQYVNLEDSRPQIPRLMSEATSFDYVLVDTEHEALVLEINLIQNYRPPFNVSLMDDKSYPFIAITTEDVYPALKYTRERHKPHTLYFGPYTDAHAARKAIDIVRKVCPLCVATCVEWKRCRRYLATSDSTQEEVKRWSKQGRPCFDYHVGKGPGVCIGAITPAEYAENVEVAKQFLTGKHKELLALLEKFEQKASFDLNFEQAERFKRRTQIIKALDGEQQICFRHNANVDVCGFWRETTIAAAFIFCVREGRVIRTCDFVLNKGTDISESELISSFLAQYYSETHDIPKRIDVSTVPADSSALTSWLEEKCHYKVSIAKPTKGERKKLLNTAERNAKHALMRYELKTGYEDARLNRALYELESALGLSTPPFRIESFDISTLHGSYTVGSMVVFEQGKPAKSQYRRFKIRQPLEEANDFASLQEVFERRYAFGHMKDSKFAKKPNLIIVDGGRPQLKAALSILKNLGLAIPVVGLAKADEEVYTDFQEDPIILPQGSSSLYLMKQIRDEAHRFAITYHRVLRSKAMTTSFLDEIQGVGPKRKKALLKYFGSAKKLKAASAKSISQVPGISKSLAEHIFESIQALKNL